jgi:CHAD domain-containing protein
VHRISDSTGAAVAELAVDVVDAVDERTGTARSWSEWEVELLDGTVPEERQEQIFAAVEAVVFAAGGKPSTSRAKIARALGEDDDAPAGSGRKQDEKQPEGKNGKKTGNGTKNKKNKKAGKKGKPAAGAAGPDVLRAVLGELAEQLVLWDFRVRLDVPDAVHQMRVTSRSLRSVLRAAKPFFDGAAAEELDARLRELARTLSAARDAEVTAELLAGRVEALEGRVGPAAAESLRQRAEEQARTAAAKVGRHVTGREHLRLLADVQDFAAHPPLTEECTRLSGREVADAVVHRALRKVVRVAEAEQAGGPGGEGQLEHLHDVRKAVKRVRYVDAVLGRTGHRPGKQLRRAARDAEDYQDELGRIMDAAVVERWLAGTAAALGRSGADRYAVGALHGAEVLRLRAGTDGGADVVGVLLSQLREDLA